MKQEEMFSVGDEVAWDEDCPYKERLNFVKERYGQGPFEITEVRPFFYDIEYVVIKKSWWWFFERKTIQHRQKLISVDYEIMKKNSTDKITGIFDHRWFKKVQ